VWGRENKLCCTEDATYSSEAKATSTEDKKGSVENKHFFPSQKVYFRPPKHAFYKSFLDSETRGDGEDAFLHQGDVLETTNTLKLHKRVSAVQQQH